MIETATTTAIFRPRCFIEYGVDMDFLRQGDSLLPMRRINSVIPGAVYATLKVFY
jgi:hypothetical protein